MENDLNNITFISKSDRVRAGYYVRVMRQGKNASKFFAIKEFQTKGETATVAKANALTAAKKYRNKLIKLMGDKATSGTTRKKTSKIKTQK